MISILTPALNESENLRVLYSRLKATMDLSGEDWEWIIVDDHSTDSTYEIVKELAVKHSKKGSEITGIRLSRNSGSHTAAFCAIQASKGDVAIVLSADIQNPPEAIPDLLAKLKEGYQIVWGIRKARSRESGFNQFGAQAYYHVIRSIVGKTGLPNVGSDYVALDRAVLDVLKNIRPVNTNFSVLLNWMGFRQGKVAVFRDDRRFGKSGWTFERKVKIFLDAVIAYSYFPLRLMIYLGFLTGLLGFVYAGIIAFSRFAGERPDGWASLMVVVLILGGLQMLMLGVLGEYIWRNLEVSSGRPSYMIEEKTHGSRV